MYKKKIEVSGQIGSVPEYIRKLKRQQLQKEQLKKLKRQPYHIDRQQMRKRKVEKEKTIEQKVKEFDLKGTEKEELERTFDIFDLKKKGQFTWRDVKRVLVGLDCQHRRKEIIELMIWEVDENLDGKVSIEQFKNMYIRCVTDQTGLQCQDLYFLTQFLMYCQPGSKTITVEDMLELLYVRVKDESEKHPQKQADEKKRLNDQIKAIFDNDEGHSSISFEEYRKKMLKKMADKRYQIEQSKKIG